MPGHEWYKSKYDGNHEKSRNEVKREEKKYNRGIRQIRLTSFCSISFVMYTFVFPDESFFSYR